MRIALLLLAMTGVAHAQTPPPGLYVESQTGSRQLRTPTGTQVNVTHRPFTVTRIFSIANNNQRFRIHVRTARWPGPGRGDRPWLSFNGKLFLGSGARTPTHSWYVFDVDHALARAFGRAHGSPVRLRKNLARHVGYRFRTPKIRYRVGDEIRIFIDMWRRGARKVATVIGGANRGPRNDSFRFEVFRGGRKLPIKKAFNFGGLAGAVNLRARNAPVSTSAKLSGWVSVTRPGRYTVRCWYRGTLVEPGSFASSYKGDQHWLFRATGTLVIDVVR